MKNIPQLLTTFFLFAVIGIATGALSAGCAKQKSVVVYTSVDQVFSEPIFREFEQETGSSVRAVFDTEETKSTGVVNRIIAEAQSPRADVFWSNDPVRPFLLIKRGLVAPYASPNASAIPANFKATDGTWTGFAARARVLLVNTEKVAAAEQPKSIRDLAKPRWKGQVAIANPLFGTTTMHIAALFSAWGEEQAKAFLSDLKANAVRIASSNGEVKRLVASGEVAIGLTDTDDAKEALQEGAPVVVIYPDQDSLGTLIMPTTVILIKGGPHPEAATHLIDFLLSTKTEQRLAEEAAHLPLRPMVPTPSEVRRLEEVQAMPVDYAQVADTMERIEPWLREWVGF